MAKWNTRTRIMSALRQVSRWDPDARAAMKLAKRPGGWECAHCKQVLKEFQVVRDHIAPVVRLDGFNGDWNAVIARLFPGVAGYQILCIPCHKTKTQAENTTRRLAA